MKEKNIEIAPADEPSNLEPLPPCPLCRQQPYVDHTINECWGITEDCLCYGGTYSLESWRIAARDERGDVVISEVLPVDIEAVLSEIEQCAEYNFRFNTDSVTTLCRYLRGKLVSKREAGISEITKRMRQMALSLLYYDRTEFKEALFRFALEIDEASKLPAPPHQPMKPTMKHSWDYCGLCEAWMVICGKCGNGCCNAGYGTLTDGSQCDSCPSAYELQESVYKQHSASILEHEKRLMLAREPRWEDEEKSTNDVEQLRTEFRARLYGETDSENINPQESKEEKDKQ